MGFEDIELENRAETSWITLSRPEAMNAVRPQTYIELAAAFEQADADRATRFIVLTGAGRGFCAGDDFNEIFLSEKNHPSKRSDGTYLLPRIIGVSRAMELLLSGELVSADEALRLGIVSRVVPHETLGKAVEELIDKLSWGAPLAQRAIKRTVQKGLAMHWQELEEYGRMLSDERWRTEDHREGVASHVEKRKPKFNER